MRRMGETRAMWEMQSLTTEAEARGLLPGQSSKDKNKHLGARQVASEVASEGALCHRRDRRAER